MEGPGGRLSQPREPIDALWQGDLGTYVGAEARAAGWYRADKGQDRQGLRFWRRAGLDVAACRSSQKTVWDSSLSGIGSSSAVLRRGQK